MITEPFKFGEFKHKVSPMKHQEENFLATRDRDVFANFWEMGCAKTKVMIDTAAWLFLKGEIDGVLVVTDKGVYENWALDQIPTHMMEGLPFRMSVWRATCGKQYQHKVNQLLVARDNVLDILIMNVEAFAGEKANTFAKAFLDSHYTLMIIDESDSIGRATAKRTNNLIVLGELANYKRILTGTPIADSPLQIYTQAQFLKPGLLGYNSFVAFRAEYANLITMDLGPGKKFYTITGYKNLDKLAESMKPWSSRLLKTECLDLPEKLYETVYVEHTDEQAKVYKQLCEESVVSFKQGLLSSVAAISTLTKLHQINCGHVKIDKTDENPDGQTIDIESNRIKVLLETLNKISGKVIIWAFFRRDFDLIGEALTKEYGPDSWVDYYGGTSSNERPENLAKFKTDPKCKYFLANTRTGGKGLNIVEATYSIYYSQGFSSSQRLQSEDRNYRQGQKFACTCIDLVTKKTIDIKILKALRSKKDISTRILDTFLTTIEETPELDAQGLMSNEDFSTLFPAK